MILSLFEFPSIINEFDHVESITFVPSLLSRKLETICCDSDGNGKRLCGQFVLREASSKVLYSIVFNTI